MLDNLIDWLAVVLPDDYVMVAGQWFDEPTIFESFVCVVQQDGGPAPVVDVRAQRFRVLLLSPRNGSAHRGRIMVDANVIVSETVEPALLPCGSANIRTLTEPVGPAFTLEKRAYSQLSIEVLF